MTSEFRRHRAISYACERACALTMLNSLVASWIPNKVVTREFCSNETAIRIAWSEQRDNGNENNVITSKIEESE